MNYMGNVPAKPEDDDTDDVYLRSGDAIELLGKRYIVESGSSNPRGYIFSDPDAPGDEQKISCDDIKA